MACAKPVHDNVSCLLCFEEIVSPRMLTCYHSFCEKCLSDYIQSQTNSYLCPVCRQEIIPIDKKLPREEWAPTFPLDKMAMSILKANEGQDNNTCDMCEDGEEKNSARAEYLCVDCQKKLCCACRQCHLRNELSKTHQVVLVEEKEDICDVKLNFEKMCSCDGGKLVEVYCVGHKEMYCSICAVTSLHHNCEVRSLDEVSEDFYRRNFLEANILKDIENLEASVDELQDGRDSIRQTTEANRSETIKTLKDILETLETKIKTTREKLKTQIDEKCTEKNSRYIHGNKLIKRFTENAKNAKHILEHFSKYGTIKQMFVANDCVISQLRAHFSNLKTEIQQETDSTFTLDLNNTILSNIDEIDIDILQEASSTDKAVQLVGEVDKILTKIISMTQVNSEMCAAQIPKHRQITNPPSPFSPGFEFVTSVSQQQIKGGNTRFTGITRLNDGRFLAADYNNNRIVQFDADYRYVRDHSIEGDPIDIASRGKDNVYITVIAGPFRRRTCYIYICKLGFEMTVVRKIKIPDNRWGIAVNDKYIVTKADGSVHVMSLDGIPISSFSCTSISGSNGYVAISPQGVIYNDGFKVVCKNIASSKDVFRYNENDHTDLKGFGLCTDPDGNVFICDRNNGNIHHVSPDGMLMREVSLHNIIEPQAVVYNPQYRDIVVTSSAEKVALEVHRMK